MSSDLVNLIRDYINSGSRSNKAVEILIGDYAKYHLVMVLIGSISSLLLLCLAFIQISEFGVSKNLLANIRTLKGKIHFYMGSLSAFLGSLLALVVIGNLGNAVKPRSGLLNSLPMLEDRFNRNNSRIHQISFFDWLKSGDSHIPKEIARIVNERLAWQRPKAILCFFLLVLVIFLSKHIWRSLIQNSQSLSRLRVVTQFSGGIATTLFAALFLVMFIGNTQGAIAPISLSLFFS